MRARLLGALLVAALVVVPTGGAARAAAGVVGSTGAGDGPTAGALATVPVLDPPVDGPVLAGFHVPTTYGAGHRGVDLGAAPGTPVRASAAGTVTFAGVVVGLRWVTVDHGGVRTTVGPLAAVRVAAGDRVVRGGLLGTSDRAHGLDAVHWSARVGDRYVDPRRVGRGVTTLLPPAASDRPASPAGSGPRRAAVPRRSVR